MQRVAVIGGGGAGKTTFAAALGRLLELPVHHLDQLYWKPGWVGTARDEWTAIQRALVQGERWVIDGNYGATLAIRMAAADTVVLLDYGRLRSVWRAARRSLRNRGQAVQAPGCPERIDWDFLWWCWRYRVDSLPRVLAALDTHAGQAAVLILHTPRETAALLRRLETERRLEASG